MSHALATVLHRGRKAASNIMSAWHPLGKRFEKRAAWNSVAPPRNAGTETGQGFFDRLVRSCRISAIRSRIRASQPNSVGL